IESAARASGIADRELRLGVVHVHLVEIQPPPKLMPAPCPGCIRYVLEIVVGPVVRHEVLSRSDGVEAGDAETRPAALESFVSIGPGNPKSIEPDVLADARMLRVGDKSDESEIPVEDQARAKKVVGPHRKVIGIAMAFARIAEAGDRRAFQCISKGG